MDSENIDHHFHRIGSRFVTRNLSKPKLTPRSRALFSINIETDKRGREFFRFDHRVPVELQVLDTRPEQRHLLMAVSGGNITRTFLCGHDERHYFAAGVDERVRNLTDAMITLQPAPVREAAQALPFHERFTRANRAFKRQGEWFFVRARGVRLDKRTALKTQPLQRGRSKPHICQYLCRTGGQRLWFHPTHASGGISQEQYDACDRNKKKLVDGWRSVVRNPEVYVKGAITHPDHATLVLRGWHRVYLNGEVLSQELGSID